MRLSAKVRVQTAKQVRLLSAVERDSDRVTKRFVQAFKRRSDFAVKRKQAFVLLPTDRYQIKQALTDLMVEAFVKRYHMEHKYANKQAELGFSATVRYLAHLMELDLGDLRKAFDWIVGERSDEAIASVEGRVNRVLSHVVSKQLPTATATREMRRLLAEEGITDKDPTVIETLVRTHSQFAFGAAQYKMDKDDPLGLIWGYTYSTVGDDRVRESHAAMQGVTRPKDDPIWDEWWPPNGWNCRCQLIPLIGTGTSTDVPDDVEPDEGFDYNIGKYMFDT